MSTKGLVVFAGIVAAAVLIGFVHRAAQPGAKPEPRKVVATQTSREITRDAYRARWPFVRLHASIECQPTNAGLVPAVVLGSQRYAFTGGSSRLMRIPLIPDAEWLDRGDAGNGKIDLTDVRDDAFRFCETPGGPFNPAKNGI